MFYIFSIYIKINIKILLHVHPQKSSGVFLMEVKCVLQE